MYQLTAEDANAKIIWRFDASSNDEATMTAIGKIMDNAYADKQGVWAKGAITLTDPDGNVIHTMDAK